MNASEVAAALDHMVANVTASVAMVAMFAGKAVIQKNHVNVIVAHIRETCGPKAPTGQAGGMGVPWSGAGAEVSAPAYGTNASGTQAGTINFGDCIARGAHEIHGGYGGGARRVGLTARALHDGIRKVMRAHNLKISKDARQVLERMLQSLGACFIAETEGLSGARLQRTLAGRRYKVFRA